MTAKLRIGLMAGQAMSGASRRVGRLALLAALPLSLIGGSAFADVTAATYGGSAAVTGNPPANQGYGGAAPTTYTKSYSNSSGSGSAISTTSDAVPGGSVYAHSEATGSTQAGAEAVINYTFQIQGLENTARNLRIQADGFVDGASSGIVSGYHGTVVFILSTQFGPSIYQQLDNYSSNEPHGYQVFTLDQILLLPTNRDITVQLQANSSANYSACSTVCNSTSTAFLDPIFTLVGPNIGDYRIVGVPGPSVTPGGPTGAVPEPSTWALMIAGFGLAGAGLRRRGRVVA